MNSNFVLTIVLSSVFLFSMVGSAFAQTGHGSAKPVIIDVASIARFSPRARADLAAIIVSTWKIAQTAQINSARRIEHFFAQIATETGGLRIIAENMNYSSQRLRQVFPSRITPEQAIQMAHKPIEIANHVYNGRLGNKPPMDGWNFRGSGLIQLTGRANFAARGKELNLDLVGNPEMVRMSAGAFQTAVAYWAARNINKIVDKGDLPEVRRAVNGGSIGLSESRIWLARAQRYLRSPSGQFEETGMNKDEQDAVTSQLQALAFIPADRSGFQDTDLAAVLRRFQQTRGIMETGIVDEDTLYELTEPDNFRSDDSSK